MNPYTPGHAQIPPVLAGRDRETEILYRMAENLMSVGARETDLVLYGPRGNGKTALLNYVHKELQATSKIRSIILLSSEIPTPNEVYDILLETPRLSEETVTTQGDVKAGFLGTGAGAKRSTAKVFESTSTDLKKRCVGQMADTPTLLFVDEAHGISRDSLLEILSLVEASNRQETNFGVVLAGTPNLPSHLREIGPTYLNRVTRVRIDRLDVDSAKTALFQPMENLGCKILLNEAERANVIEETQCYPHFIQCVGHAIWEQTEASQCRVVNSRAVDSAAADWQERVNAMYQDRLEELEERNLMPYAVAVAEAFSGTTSMHVEQIIEVIRSAVKESTQSFVLSSLVDLGYIWRRSAGTARMYEPGIPSLMDHVLEDHRLEQKRRQGSLPHRRL